VIEAQYFGIPAVSSDVGGARETLDDGVTGWLVHPNSPAEIYAEKLLEVFSDKTWRARAKRKAQAFVVERFSTERTVARLIDLYGMR
jgi:glycosyltransferase involved in cell wall biosynthesis